MSWMCMHVLLDLDMHVPASQFVFWPNVFSCFFNFQGEMPWLSWSSSIFFHDVGDPHWKILKMHSSAIFGIVFWASLFKQRYLLLALSRAQQNHLSSKLLGWSIWANKHPCLRICKSPVKTAFTPRLQRALFRSKSSAGTHTGWNVIWPRVLVISVLVDMSRVTSHESRRQKSVNSQLVHQSWTRLIKNKDCSSCRLCQLTSKSLQK